MQMFGAVVGMVLLVRTGISTVALIVIGGTGIFSLISLLFFKDRR